MQKKANELAARATDAVQHHHQEAHSKAKQADSKAASAEQKTSNEELLWTLRPRTPFAAQRRVVKSLAKKPVWRRDLASG